MRRLQPHRPTLAALLSALMLPLLAGKALRSTLTAPISQCYNASDLRLD